MWEQQLIETTRGTFEYFVKGNGEPLAITHFYVAFNEKGNWFANPFTEHYQVFLINVRGAGNSPVIETDEQMNLEEIILDLEVIREALHIPKWAFAGHSTGGMLALQYAVLNHQSLTKCICGCSAASKAYAIKQLYSFNSKKRSQTSLREYSPQQLRLLNRPGYFLIQLGYQTKNEALRMLFMRLAPFLPINYKVY